MRLLLLSFVLVLVSLPLGASTKTVCSSGCDYTLTQDAYNYAMTDCLVTIIQITAAYDGGPMMFMDNRPGCGPLTIRSSRWLELVTRGKTVNPYQNTGDQAFLAIANGTNFSVGTLRIGYDSMQITAVDTTNDWISLSSGISHPAQAMAVGMAISFRDTGNGTGATATPQPGLPNPLARFTKYYVVGVQNQVGGSVDVRVSLTLGGTRIHMLDSAGVNMPSVNTYDQPQAALYDVAHDITFLGISFVNADPGANNINSFEATALVGNGENTPTGRVRNISLLYCAFWHGPTAARQARGLPTGIAVEADSTLIRRCYIEAYGYNGSESHGVTTLSAQGLTIQDNIIASIGAATFTGGSTGPVPLLQVTGLNIQHNYMPIWGWMYVFTNGDVGSRTPNVPCYYGPDGTGAIFLDLTGGPTDCSVAGTCQVCQSGGGSWSNDTTRAFPGSGTPTYAKTRVEFKSGTNVNVSGNYIYGNVYRGDSGNTGWLSFILVYQSPIVNNVFIYGHNNVNVRNNWADYIYSGLVVGQTAEDIAPTPSAITNITTIDSNTFRVTTGWQRYGYMGISGLSATGNMQYLNGRCFGNTNATGGHVDLLINDDCVNRWSTSGAYTSGGTVTTMTWPTSKTIVLDNNLLTRTGAPELSPDAGAGAQQRPFRIYISGLGAPIVTRTTVRQASNGSNYFGITFENSDGPYVTPVNSQAVIKNSILSSTHQGTYSSLTSADCSLNGYGAFSLTGANVSHMLMFGTNAGWPTAPGSCLGSATLLTAANDAAVKFLNSTQTTLANNALDPTSAYSAAAGCTTLCNDDGTDLGTDVPLVAAFIDGASTGTQPATANLRINLGSTKVLFSINSPGTCSTKIYNMAARITANLVSTTASTITDGLRNETVVPSLSASTEYWGLMTCTGIVDQPLHFVTMAAGSGTYNWNIQGSGLRYSSSSNMASPTTATGGIVPVATNSVVYIDHGAGTSIYALVAR